MCWGQQPANSQNATNKTATTTPNPLTLQAAQLNYGMLQDIAQKGFTPYGGQQVADFGNLQNQSFGRAQDIANAGVPYVGDSQNYIGNYGNAGPQSVSPERISQNMSPYMNQYVMQALAPQLQQQQYQFEGQNRAADSAATGAGAFGNDSQAALGKSNLSLNQDIARQGLIGNAYNSAFNTAIGAGAQDTANNLQGQTTNASLNEQALSRQLGAAGALQNLGSYDVNTGINQAELLNRYGAQQTAQGQAGLNAKYNQWLMATQYPFQVAQLANQTTQGLNSALGQTKSEAYTASDNSGWNALGSFGGSFLGGAGNQLGAGAGAAGLMMLSDARMKENIAPVGKLLDDSTVYSFSYKGDPDQVTHLGLMAQEVEKKTPGAVREISGIKHVDYEKATAPARGLARALALVA